MRRFVALLAAIATVFLQGALSTNASMQLDGTTILMLPNTSIEFLNTSYFFSNIYSLPAGSRISGKLDGLSSISDVSLYPLSLSKNSELIKRRILYPFNSSTSFSIQNAPAGVYMLMARNRSQSDPLALALLIVQNDLIMSAPDRLVLGNSMTINLQARDGMNHIYGAILMPLTEYNLIAIRLDENISISRNETSAVLSKLRSEAFMDLLPIIPAQGTIAVEPQPKEQSTLTLITESGWQKGPYMLTGASYSQKGISIAQRIISME